MVKMLTYTQNSKALRRLAADHSSLHRQPLPPNYLFPPNGAEADDLIHLDILLAGPSHTPFAAGVWKLHLSVPPTYPTAPPTANFRTPIFHPNVDPNTGGVCVETLKRDWDSKLTLRDVLVTVSCLLIQPNPDSALNAEAGSLIQDDYETFTRRAKLMTGIHAKIPKTLAAAVKEAQERGHELEVEQELQAERQHLTAEVPERSEMPAPARRRRQTARHRGAVACGSGTSDQTPTRARTAPVEQSRPSRPFVLQTCQDDIFGISIPHEAVEVDSDEDMVDENQENDEARSPVKRQTPVATTPKRPNGAPVPLGELTLDDGLDTSQELDAEDLDMEFPPSPKKSPVKQRRQGLSEEKSDAPFQSRNDRSEAQGESSRMAAMRTPTFTTPVLTTPAVTTPVLTPPQQVSSSPFSFEPRPTMSPRKSPQKASAPAKLLHKKAGAGGLFGSTVKRSARTEAGILKKATPSIHELRRVEQRKKEALEKRLWKLCGEDVVRWNRGDFGGHFPLKAARW